MATALEIAQSAASELGLPEPSTLFGGTRSTTARQLASLINRVGIELATEYDWTALQKEFVVEVAAPTDTTGNTTLGSRSITGIPSTSGLSDAYSVTGTGLTQASRIVSVDSATAVTLNQPATATGTGVALSFVKDAFALPDDFGRYIGDTWWDRTSQWQLIGPQTPRQDAYQRSGIIQSGPRRRWRQSGGVWRVWPPPTASDTPSVLVWEYISTEWAETSAEDPLSKMTADTDVPLFPEHVMVLGLKAFLWMAKGFDWSALYQQFVMAARRAVGQDGGARDIVLGGAAPIPDLTDPGVPDGSWETE